MIESAQEALQHWRQRDWDLLQPLMQAHRHTLQEMSRVLGPALDNMLRTDTLAVARLIETLGAEQIAGLSRMAETVQTIMASVGAERWNAIANLRSNLIGSLPNLRPSTDEFHLTREALRDADLHALVGPVPYHVVAGVGGVETKVQGAWLTNRILGFTRSQEFACELEEAFKKSLTLQDRWPAVAEALVAHKQRRYLLSIPTLLAQTEGVVGDALILSGLIQPQRGKLYILDADGNRKRDKKDKFLEIHGATDLARESRRIDDATLNTIADYVTTIFVGNRNPILHGRRQKYRSPKLSAQSLLALLIFAGGVREFEQAG